MKILADATLPQIPYHPFFSYSLYHNNNELQEQIISHDILICRSTLKVNQFLLENTKLQCIATASSGIDHIDLDTLKQKNITLFDAKGSNANSVADYVRSCLDALKMQDIKYNLTAGIIGMGYVGTKVYQQLSKLGFKIYAYDPLKPCFKSCLFDELKQCDIIFVHANLHKTQPFPSYNLINDHFLSTANSKIIINAARGNIVNEQDILKYPKIIYCTDVYSNEPNINPEIINYATICTPHIAGHSLEAKQHTMYDLRDKIYTKYLIEQNRHHTDAMKLNILQHINPYDPMNETFALKKAIDKKAAFIDLRKQHLRQECHNF